MNYHVSKGLHAFITKLIRDSKHWTLYATGNNLPEGIKFHATDHGNSRNPLKYEDGRVGNPLRSRALPRHESRWLCRVFLLQGLKQLNDDGLIFLPPDLGTALTITFGVVDQANCSIC